MMLPLLIGAALVGSAYLGAFGVSRYVLGPTESLATDAPVLYLDERAPAARLDAPRPDPLPAQASRRADQGLAQALHAADQDFTVHAGGPLVTSPDSLPSTLTVHNAPAKARPEAALALAAASTEAVEPELAQDDAGIDATAPVLELDALASHESAAGGEPAAAAEDVEPIILDSLYGPQP
jgi:hypothetical protein